MTSALLSRGHLFAAQSLTRPPTDSTVHSTDVQTPSWFQPTCWSSRLTPVWLPSPWCILRVAGATVYLSIYPSDRSLMACPSAYSQLAGPSISAFIHFTFVCSITIHIPFVRLPTCCPVHPYLHLTPTSPFIHPSIHPLIHLPLAHSSVWLSVHPNACLLLNCLPCLLVQTFYNVEKLVT